MEHPLSKKYLYPNANELNNELLCSKDIVIYGAGNNGEIVLNELRNNEINPLFFIDMNADNKDSAKMGLPVYSISSFVNKNLDKEIAIIITPVRYYDIITQILNSFGYYNLYYSHYDEEITSGNDGVYWYKYTNNINEIPVPPIQLTTYGLYKKTFLESGKRDFDNIIKILEKNNYKPYQFKRIYEFGCGDCRILRHFIGKSDKTALFGSDIDLKRIKWGIENLENIHLFINNLTPPLPFADGFFDFIYAGSVFTHLTDYHTAWIAEIARIVRSGGCVYLSFHDESFVDKLTDVYHKMSDKGRKFWSFIFDNPYVFEKLTKFDFDFLSTDDYDIGQAHVFMSNAYIERITRHFFEPLDVIPYAYGNMQTVYLFKRKADW